MVESKTITEQLTDLNKIIDDLVKIEDKNKTLLLFCALPRSFDHFKDTMFMVKKPLSP
jgi:hypothetical protein